jgi:hypothetical protein
LKIRAALDKGYYETGKEASDEGLHNIKIKTGEVS